MIFLDIETYSELPLGDVGVYKYATQVEVLLLSYCIDDGPVKTIDFTKPSEQNISAVFSLYESTKTHDLCAHNANFERTVLASDAWLTIPEDPTRWHDTMILALTLGLPGKLETLCQALGMDEDRGKIKEGSALINRFCKPAPDNHKASRYTKETHPDEWKRFTEYCERDALLVRELWHTLPRNNYNKEHKYWILDQATNDRGLPIDVELATKAARLVESTITDYNEELFNLTRGVVTSVTQVGKLKAFLRDRGYPCPEMGKDKLPGLIVEAPCDVTRRVLEIRQAAAKSSAAKYTAALDAQVDNRLRGSLQFYGARSGRWAGRLVQPQNMMRPTIKNLEPAICAIKNETVDLLYDDAMEVASSCVRAMIAIPPTQGGKLVVSDLANIEGRVLAWLAGEEWKLQAFRDFDAGTGDDLYKLAYARANHTSVSKVTSEQRQIGKVMELALGYQGAVGAFNQMAAGYGVDLPKSTVLSIVKGWRKAHPEVVSFWYGAQDAAIRAATAPGTLQLSGPIVWLYERKPHPILWCKLPSGRWLCYWDPQVRTEFSQVRNKDEVVLSYMGVAMPSRKWERISTYGGKLVENITQAVARDILAEGMLLAEQSGYPPVLTVHDEVVCETRDDINASANHLSSILAMNPEWCQELPLSATGYESRFYKKD